MWTLRAEMHGILGWRWNNHPFRQGRIQDPGNQGHGPGRGSSALAWRWTVAGTVADTVATVNGGGPGRSEILDPPHRVQAKKKTKVKCFEGQLWLAVEHHRGDGHRFRILTHLGVLKFAHRLTCRNYFQRLDLLVGVKFADVVLLQRSDGLFDGYNFCGLTEIDGVTHVWLKQGLFRCDYMFLLLYFG